MVMSIRKVKMPNFTFDGETLENVTCIKYLGIYIHKNGKFDSTLKDRTAKSTRAIFMLKQLSTQALDYPVKLALSLFAKQIEPILLYGSAVWGLPDCNRHILIQVNNIDTRVKDQTNKILKAILDKDNMIEEVKPIRNKNIIHVKLRDVEDKINIMSQRHLCNNTCQISEYKRKTSSQIDVPHCKYCKFILGLSNSSSAMGSLNRLHRIPMTIKAAIRNILYWHRLENNTTTAPLLNEAYTECKREGHICSTKT